MVWLTGLVGTYFSGHARSENRDAAGRSGRGSLRKAGCGTVHDLAGLDGLTLTHLHDPVQVRSRIRAVSGRGVRPRQARELGAAMSEWQSYQQRVTQHTNLRRWNTHKTTRGSAHRLLPNVCILKPWERSDHVTDHHSVGLSPTLKRRCGRLRAKCERAGRPLL